MHIGDKSANLQKGRKMNHGPMHAHLSEKNQAKKGKKSMIFQIQHVALKIFTREKCHFLPSIPTRDHHRGTQHH